MNHGLAKYGGLRPRAEKVGRDSVRPKKGTLATPACAGCHPDGSLRLTSMHVFCPRVGKVTKEPNNVLLRQIGRAAESIGHIDSDHRKQRS
ncbi:hypothetical protein ACFX13_024336 [Malus domestica]